MAGRPTTGRFDPKAQDVASETVPERLMRPSDVVTDDGRDASPDTDVLSVPARAGPVGITTSAASRAVAIAIAAIRYPETVLRMPTYASIADGTRTSE